MLIDNFCLIIGTQKGGTTSLFSYLSQHPQVASSSVKETNFFSEDAQWEKGLDYYENLWNWESGKHLIALEASPNYTNSLQEAETVAQRIKKTSHENNNSKFRFIYILRDPLNKIESMRKQGVYQGWYTPLLAKETPTTVPTEVIERVQYAEIIDKFVEKFSRENVLLLEMEELSPNRNPAAVMQKVCRFLGVDPTFEFSLNKIHNSRNSYRNDTLWHVLRSSKYLRAFKGIFPNSIKNNLRNVLSQPPKKSDRVVSPLTLDQKTFILNALSNDLRKLETTYGLDISNWDWIR